MYEIRLKSRALEPSQRASIFHVSKIQKHTFCLIITSSDAIKIRLCMQVMWFISRLGGIAFAWISCSLLLLFTIDYIFCFDIVGTLEETLKLSAEEFKERYGRDKPSNDTEVIFSCKLGGRATKAAEVAQSLGLENSRIYAGSWTEWAAHKNQN